MKKCYLCKETMLEAAFYVCRKQYDGLDGKCKKCRKEYYKQYSLKNREKISARQAAWYKRKHATS